jgi:hypothetical protein
MTAQDVSLGGFLINYKTYVQVTYTAGMTYPTGKTLSDYLLSSILIGITAN